MHSVRGLLLQLQELTEGPYQAATQSKRDDPLPSVDSNRVWWWLKNQRQEAEAGCRSLKAAGGLSCKAFVAIDQRPIELSSVETIAKR